MGKALALLIIVVGLFVLTACAENPPLRFSPVPVTITSPQDSTYRLDLVLDAEKLSSLPFGGYESLVLVRVPWDGPTKFEIRYPLKVNNLGESVGISITGGKVDFGIDDSGNRRLLVDFNIPNPRPDEFYSANIIFRWENREIHNTPKVIFLGFWYGGQEGYEKAVKSVKARRASDLSSNLTAK